MFNPQVGRLLRKALVLAVLLTSLTVVNTDSGLRKVAAQATCCQNCGFAYVTCLNSCLDQYSCTLGISPAVTNVALRVAKGDVPAGLHTGGTPQSPEGRGMLLS